MKNGPAYSLGFFFFVFFINVETFLEEIFELYLLGSGFVVWTQDDLGWWIFSDEGIRHPEFFPFFFLGGWGRRDLIVVLFDSWKEEAEMRLLVDWCHICACNVGCILSLEEYVSHDVMFLNHE